MHDTLELHGRGLTIADVVSVARHGTPVVLADEARRAMERSAAVLADLVAGDRPVYGVTTGFGSLANTVIPAERTAELQVALVRSHAAGMGPAVETEVVRAMLLLRARSLAMGFSGARPALVDLQLALLGHGLTPVVPEHGSLGASGDLAPLSPLRAGADRRGRGLRSRRRCHVPPPRRSTGAGLRPLVLRAKEGLALINGTDGILGMLCLALHDLGELLRLADVTAAMTVEALLGTDRAFAADLQALRPQVGQAASAAQPRAGCSPARRSSPATASATTGCRTPTRCGARRRCTAPPSTRSPTPALIAERELDAAIDNPMILPDGRVESCGNFHGAPLALRVRLPRRSRSARCRRSPSGAPTGCSTRPARTACRRSSAPDAGVNSGLMIAHYTQAAMAMENQRLAVPASVQSLPTERDAGGPRVERLGRGPQAAPDASTNLRRILAVELVCAGAGPRPAGPAAPRRRAPAPPSPRSASASPVPGPDRWLSPDLAAAEDGARRRQPCSRRSSRVVGTAGGGCDVRSPPRRVPPRGSDLTCLGLAPGGRLPDAAQQPRPRGGRATRRPRRLRRHGPGGPQLGGVRRHGAHAARRCAPTRRCSCSRASRSACSAPTSGRRGCCSPTRTSCPSGRTWDEFRRLEAMGLTMYGQMTAGSWIYIGTQGILQGTYECFAEIARRRFGGTLAGTITLTAGLGGMGGAQPLAVTMNGGVALCIEVDRDRAERRVETRYLDEVADSVDDAVARCTPGPRRAARRCRSGWSATPPSWCRACSTSTSRPTSSPTRPAPTTRSATCRPTSRPRPPPSWPAPTPTS